jgi:predicted transcriptional regulator
MAGTFDSVARAVGLLPHRLAFEQAAGMTVTQGGAVHGEEFRHGERKPVPADPVRRIMVRNPVGVAPEATLREVARELADDVIGTVVVESPGGTIGLVSERDLIEAVAAGDDLDDRQVADLMSTDLVTARPADAISTVAMLMDDAGVRHILVADGATVVGIVSVRDVLPVLLRSL